MAKTITKKDSVNKTSQVSKSKLLEDSKILKDKISIKINETSKAVPESFFENTESKETLREVEKAEIKTDKEVISETIEKTETQTQETILKKESNEQNALPFLEDLGSPTQEDVDNKNKENSTTNIEERLLDSTSDNFEVNENPDAPEDSPEFRQQMNKIRASALTEFFDVVFMIVCLFISKDFTDKAQTRFSLTTQRKNAIKSNVYAVLNASKKKTNPISAIFFLIIFSYIPLIALAFMERRKSIQNEKKEKEKESENEARIIHLQRENDSLRNSRTYEPVSVNQKQKERRAAKVEDSEKVSFNEKTRVYKNLTTGKTYKEGQRGKRPSWVGSFGKVA